MDYSGGIDVQQLQKLLVAAWLMVGAPLIVAALPVPFLEPLRKLLWPILRRGKLLGSDESAGRGLLDFTVPQSYFTHFYVLGVVWNSVFFWTALGFAIACSRPASPERNIPSLTAYLTGASASETVGSGRYARQAWRLTLLQLLLEIHLTRRLYECLFVSSFDSKARMSLVGYFVGLGYYVMVPLTLFLPNFQDEGFVRAFKGYLIHKMRGGQVLLSETAPEFSDIVFYIARIGWMFYLGAAICLYGSVHQHVCHQILASIRTEDQPKSGKRYGIPRGDWFEVVSSAHYFAEIVIYAGFLVASGGVHLAVWIMFFSVVANLYLLAKPTHAWYVSKFDNYPKTRQALFPYIG